MLCWGMAHDGDGLPREGFGGRSLETPAIRPSTVKLPERPPQGEQTIFGDPLYGSVRSYDPDDTSQRLWLDAHRLAVRAFPGAPGNNVLTADWTSSRPPTEFFQHAANQPHQRRF